MLAETPAEFQERHVAARWGAVLRRAIPTLTGAGLIAVAASLPYITDGSRAGLWVALQYVPVAALALAFSLQEMAQFEIPRPPRRLKAARWRTPAAAPTPQ